MNIPESSEQEATLSHWQEQATTEYIYKRKANHFFGLIDFFRSSDYHVPYLSKAKKRFYLMIHDTTYNHTDIKGTNRKTSEKKLITYIHTLPNEQKEQYMQEYHAIKQYIFGYLDEEKKQEIAENLRIETIKFAQGDEKDQPILRSLYQLMKGERKLYRDIQGSEQQEVLVLNERGKEFLAYVFTSIMTDLEHQNILTKSDTFPDNKLHTVIHEIERTQRMERYQAVDIIRFLTHKTLPEDLQIQPKYRDLRDDQLKSLSNEIDAKKSLVLNYCLSFLQCIIDINYKYITETLGKNLPTLVHKLANSLNTILDPHGKKPIVGVKGRGKRPASASNKLHSKSSHITDLIGTKAYVDKEYFLTDQESIDALSKSIPVSIQSIIQYIQEQIEEGDVNIHTISIINLMDIFNTHEARTTFITTLQHTFPDYTITGINKYTTAVSGSPHTPISEKNIGYIQQGNISQTAVEKLIHGPHHKKPGNRGNFQDIKIKIDYSIKNESLQLSSGTGGWEHAIVRSNHDNETGIASHALGHSWMKQIRSFSKNISTVGMDLCWQLFKGRFESHIDTMTKWHRGIYEGHTPAYIRNQFPKQNKIILPYSQQVIEIHTLKDDPRQKIHVMKELCAYFMEQLIISNELQRVYYLQDMQDLELQESTKKEILELSLPRIKDILETPVSQWHKHRFCTDIYASANYAKLSAKLQVMIHMDNDTYTSINIAHAAHILDNQRNLTSNDILTNTTVGIISLLDTAKK